MITIKLNYFEFRQAAFNYQQKVLKEIQEEQNKLVDEYLAGFWLFRRRTRIGAMQHLEKDSRRWRMLSAIAKKATEEYCKIRTACNLAEDGIVTVDAETVYRIFGDRQ